MSPQKGSKRVSKRAPEKIQNPLFPLCFCSKGGPKGPKKGLQTGPKTSPSLGPKWDPKGAQKRAKNGPEIGPKPSNPPRAVIIELKV